MEAEIINIGTELLLGQTINTNAATIGQKIASLGINIRYQLVVEDNKERLVECLKTSLERSNIVITTGGLGPTVDDLTVQAIAEVLDNKLVLNQQILSRIKAHFKQRKARMPASNIRQAYVPEKARVIENHIGTAPGLIIKSNSKYIIALPGVPREIEAMMKEVILFLKRITREKSIIKSRLIKITGMSESAVNDNLKDLFTSSPEMTIGIYAHPGQIDLRITAKAKNAKEAEQAIMSLEKEIRKRLKEHIFGVDTQTLESVLADLLIQQKKTISVAESCTGGLIANRLTNVPGSSKYFRMGIVAYSNEAKINELKVPSRIIRQHGAVSRYTALAMAEGIEELTGSHLSLGVTGIAGPHTSEKKPVGLVYIALVAEKKQARCATPSRNNKHLRIKEYVRHCHKYNFVGNRDMIRYSTSQAALDMVRRYLLGYI